MTGQVDGLFYVVTVALAGDVASVDLDTKSGFTQGTCDALFRAAPVVVSVRHPDGTHVSTTMTHLPEADPAPLYTLGLDSGSLSDNDTVVVLLFAERGDPSILQAPFVDGSGAFVPEANKPALTAADLALLDPVTEEVSAGHPLIGQTIQVTLPSLIGKVGYPYHANVVDGGETPTRDVTYAELEA